MCHGDKGNARSLKAAPDISREIRPPEGEQ